MSRQFYSKRHYDRLSNGAKDTEETLAQRKAHYAAFAKLHEEMEVLVGEELNVNIEEQNGRLLFRLWKTHRWGVLTLYYFPVKFVEALGPGL